jgi:hypothetical protein
MITFGIRHTQAYDDRKKLVSCFVNTGPALDTFKRVSNKKRGKTGLILKEPL